MLGLHCRAGFSPVALQLPSLAHCVASLLAERGLKAAGFRSGNSRALEHSLSSCAAVAERLQGTRDLLGPEIKHVSPELAGVFLTTEPPGKPKNKGF